MNQEQRAQQRILLEAGWRRTLDLGWRRPWPTDDLTEYTTQEALAMVLKPREDSPFAQPEVMDGYPLDKRESVAVRGALARREARREPARPQELGIRQPMPLGRALALSGVAGAVVVAIVKLIT